MSDQGWHEAMEAAAALRSHGDFTGAEAVYADCVAIAETTGNDEQLANAIVLWSAVKYHLGHADESRDLALRGQAVARANGLVFWEGGAINLLGLLAMQRRDWDSAHELFGRALERAYDARDDKLVGAICMNLGAVCNIKGDLREARSYYLESIGSGVRSSDRRQLVMAYNNLGMVCSDLEEWMEALVYFGRGIEIAGEGDGDPLLATLHVNQAEPLIATGELDRALESLYIAESNADGSEGASVLADSARFRGRIARLRDDLEEAERCLALALERARDDRFALNRAETLEEQGLLLAQRGDPESALQRLTMARTEFTAIGAQRDAERVAASVARIFTAEPSGG